MNAAAELEMKPVSKHQIQPEYGDKQADVGRDGWTRLARPNSQARTGTRKYYFPCLAYHEQDWQPYPVDPYSAICDDHTYITYIHSSPEGGTIILVILCTMYSHHLGQLFIMDSSRVWINRVTNPARGQLNRENEYFPVPVRA